MKFTEIINESKNIGIIYHFTKQDFLLGILKNGLYGNTTYANNFFKNFIKKSEEDLKKIKNKFYSYSFTRDKNLNIGSFRITLNGNKMSNKYKFILISEPEFKRNNQTSESEERIISNKKSINIIQYIVEISYERNSIGDKTESFLEIKNFCDENNIKLKAI